MLPARRTGPSLRSSLPVGALILSCCSVSGHLRADRILSRTRGLETHRNNSITIVVVTEPRGIIVVGYVCDLFAADSWDQVKIVVVAIIRVAEVKADFLLCRREEEMLYSLDYDADADADHDHDN